MNGRKAGISDEAVKGCPEEVACEQDLQLGGVAEVEVGEEMGAAAGRENRRAKAGRVDSTLQGQ